VGIAVVFPVRQTDMPCTYLGEPGPNPWCDAHPHWCDGGCPLLVHKTMQWGRIPAQAATGLEARLLAKHYFDARILRAKNTPGRLALAPGQEVVLSSVGLVDGPMGSLDPRTDFPEVLNP